jgi:hypothetical protein
VERYGSRSDRNPPMAISRETLISCSFRKSYPENQVQDLIKRMKELQEMDFLASAYLLCKSRVLIIKAWNYRTQGRILGRSC